MLNPYYGLFQYSRDDIYTLQINPDSAVNPVSLSHTRQMEMLQNKDSDSHYTVVSSIVGV